MSTHATIKEDALQTAREWMKKHIVIDGLGGGPTGEGFIKDLQGGGVSAMNWTVAGAGSSPKAAFMNMLNRKWLVRRVPDKCTIVHSAAEIEKARAEGKVAIIHGWQGAEALEDDYHWLEVFYDYGLRIIQFTYNGENKLAYGCLEPHDAGLKRFGIDILQDCNRLGILLDGSHVGERSTLDIIEMSKDPVIFSHSNAKAVWDNGRNISDTQIKECAAKGGVIGTVTFSAFVGDTTGNRRPTVDDWMKHVDHMVNLVGIDHVAIGSDVFAFPGAGAMWSNNTGRRYRDIAGEITFETHDIAEVDFDYNNFPNLVAALVQRGYKEEDVAKIIGGNWLRVYRQVWRG